MTNKLIFIGSLILAVGLALCWYPLKVVSETQIGSAQLLFFAFAAASLCTLPWLAYQVKSWRGRSQSLLQVALSGSLSLTFLHFSLLYGEPLTVFGIFCLVPAVILFLRRTLGKAALNIGELAVLMMVIVASMIILFGIKGGLNYQWNELGAVVAGAACFLLFMLHGKVTDIPLGSKVAGIFICSTWLVGMAIIFSPRFINFPHDNAMSTSALYGALCLIPVVFSVLYILRDANTPHFLLWISLLLVISLISVALFKGEALTLPIGLSAGLLALAALLQSKRTLHTLKVG